MDNKGRISLYRETCFLTVPMTVNTNLCVYVSSEVRASGSILDGCSLKMLGLATSKQHLPRSCLIVFVLDQLVLARLGRQGQQQLFVHFFSQGLVRLPIRSDDLVFV